MNQMVPSTDAIFYNAINIRLDSSYAKIRSLKNKFGDWEKAWYSLSSSSPPPKLPSGIDLILLEDKSFPPFLREIPNPPFGIYIKGELPREENCIAIVGTRKVTEEGKAWGREFGERLAESGFTIISGLAFGLDKAAHEGALGGNGRTVAVLANGLNSVYPRSNELLAKKILENKGALVSEYHPDSKPMPFRFLERNRIVSGLSRGTIVIEAPVGSGSLITARFALEQNRDVFVMPGPAKHPNYKGSHELIRSGATLITSVEQVLEEYGLAESEKSAPLATSEEKVILDVLKHAGKPLTADMVAETAKMDIQTVNQALSFLLIKSNIKENGTGYSL